MVLASGGVGTRDAGRKWVRLDAAWQDIKLPLLLFLLFRLFLSASVYILSPLLPASHYGTPWQAMPDQPLLDVLARWDSGWYASIAMSGYRFATDGSSNVAFLPVYPIAIKTASYLTGNVWVSGILVSNLAFLASLIMLYKLTRLKFGREAAGRTVLYVSVFPAAFFFFSMYSESVYLLTVVATFYLWERRKGWSAGVFGALASLTRPMGILLFLAGAARQFIEDRCSPGPRWSWNSLVLLLIPLGFGTFLVYSYLAFGEPLAFLKSREVGWNEPVTLVPISHRELFASIVNGTVFAGGVPRLRLLDAASGIIFLALTIPIFRRLGLSYGVFSLGSVVMPLVANLDGLTRYVSVIFPGFMIMGLWVPKKPVMVALCSLSAVLMALMASMFARWYFVG